MAERILYLPSVGLALVVADAVEATTRRSLQARRWALVVGAVCLLALATRTVLRNPVWRSSATVIASLEADHPRSYVAVHARAVRAFNTGHVQEADSLMLEAVQLMPWHYGIVVDAAQIQALLGNWPLANSLYQRAKALYPASRDAYLLVGRRLLEAGHARDARTVALEGIREVDAAHALWDLLADTWEADGRWAAAERAREAA